MLKKKAIFYVIALACLHEIDIAPRNACLPNLKSIHKSRYTESIEESLTHWMCTTGEMCNHKPVTCHCDGNNSHNFESHSLFHRAGTNPKYGFLYLPLDNIVLQIIYDKQEMVCSLNQTPHIADESRSTFNISKVHGPVP